ncbi:hypothetical protein P7C71_g2990, partial [Lecanoromycetidae sp. Uapishka_2]
MLTRRLFSPSSTSTSALLRTLSTTSSHQRSPALGDITPNDASSFDSKQAKFREQVRTAEAAKKAQDSQSSATTSSSRFSNSPTAPYNAVPGAAPGIPASNASSDVSDVSHGQSALGSLATHVIGSAREQNTKQEGNKRKGALSSLIYGTHEGQQMDQEIEKSFSQVLARGKYVHSIVMHTVKPDKVDEYVDLVGSWYPRVAGMPENHVHLVGSWRTEVGDCDTFIHIWEYQRYHGYHASLHSIQHHPDFPAFDTKLKTLITHKQTSLMQEFSFWPTTPPRQLGGLFELRSYT